MSGDVAEELREMGEHPCRAHLPMGLTLRQGAERITALEAENARLKEALQAIELGTYPRPVGKAWFPDGRASKHDQCIHDVWMYEPCEGCLDTFVAAALSPIQTGGER